MKYYPKYDRRRKKVNAQHAAAIEEARKNDIRHTYLWADGGWSWQ